MGVPKTPASPNTASVGFTTKLVTISAITADGLTAICVDKGGTEVRVPMYIQRSKGALPEPGEQWIISQDIAMGWSFAAIATTSKAPFVNPAATLGQAVYGDTPGAALPGSVTGAAPGSLPGSAIAPHSITDTEIAYQAISSLNLAVNAAGTNIILDPKFTSDPINLTRIQDPGTAGTWVLASPAATTSGAALATLALMPSTLVPLYVSSGEQYYLSVSVGLSGGTGVSAGIQFAFDDGSFLGPVLPVASGSNLVAQLVTIPAGVASAYVRLIVTGLSGGATAAFTNPVCYITAGPNQLQPGSVGNAAIQVGAVQANSLAAGSVSTNSLQANAVNASKILANTIGVAQLQVGLVMAGIVDATVVTGATLQNHASDPRTSVNPDGSITITNSSGVAIFKIGPDGTVDWYNSAGFLQMELQPGGTQAIYQSLTGPSGMDFEPPSAPQGLFTQFSAVSNTAYFSAITQAVKAGATVTVIISAAGATDATGVTDSQGNTYTLISSNTTGQHQQVFQAVGIRALTMTGNAGGPDTITMTMSAANTQQKNFVAVATNFVPTVTPLDFSQTASGTSAAPSVTGTPASFGDALLFIASWGTAGGAGTVPDGWQQAASANVSGQQWTSIWYSSSMTGSPVTASAAITSAPWAAVLLGYKASPLQPLSTAPVPVAAALAASTIWADNGVFSCRVTKVGTAAQWGILFPPVAAQANSPISMRAIVYTQSVALPALDWGFTFYSGPNGTGTNLGSRNYAASYGNLNATLNVRWFLTWADTAPAGAVSAVPYVLENQADTAGNYFLVDNHVVPGGLAYSNSPVVTSDIRGNQIDQGINFIGLPGLTNVFGVEDPFTGNQLANIDGQGNITGQTVTANTDLQLAGQSLLNDILPNFSQGIVTRGWCSAAGNWPPTPIGSSETPILELDFIVPAGREYLLQVLQATFIPSISGNTQMIQRLKYTTNGSTPTTGSTEIAGHSPGVQGMVTANSGQNMPTPYMEWIMPIPVSDTTYRMLLTASIQAGTFQYALGSESLEMRVTDAGNNSPVNNGTMLGTGTGGGSTPQTYTEHFYGNTTWSYNEFGLRTSNGTLYQGAYSGEGFAQHSWVQWSGGDKGNSLNTVLNYSVSKVTLRLLNQHTWYNSGMTVSLHSSGGPVGSIPAISGELGSAHNTEGAFNVMVLPPSVWAPFKAGGITYLVLRPPGGSLDLSYYGYYWGGGTNNANVPMLTVTYTH